MVNYEQPLCSQVCPSLFPSAPSPVHSSNSIPFMSPLTDFLIFPSPLVWLSFQLPILLLSSCLASHTSPYVDIHSCVHIAAHPPSVQTASTHSSIYLALLYSPTPSVCHQLICPPSVPPIHHHAPILSLHIPLCGHPFIFPLVPLCSHF